MHTEVKEYLPIGSARLQNIKVYKYEDVKDLDSLKEVTPIYEGMVDDAPREIREMKYVKCQLGSVTIYYV